MRREQNAKDTVLILEQGHYQSPDGHVIDETAEVIECVGHTQYYDAEILEQKNQSPTDSGSLLVAGVRFDTPSGHLRTTSGL
jgi:hypothetical protein